MRDRGVLLGSGDAAAPKLASALCSRLSIRTMSLKSERSAVELTGGGVPVIALPDQLSGAVESTHTSEAPRCAAVRAGKPAPAPSSMTRRPLTISGRSSRYLESTRLDGYT